MIESKIQSKPESRSVPAASNTSQTADRESVEYCLVEEEKVPEVVSVGLGTFKKMSGLLAGIEYPTVLSASVGQVSFTSGVASSLLSWNPTGLATFTDFALLFSQYRVDKVETSVWFPDQAGATLDQGAAMAIIAPDPAVAISTPSSVNVSDLSHSVRINPRVSTKTPFTVKWSAKEVPLAVTNKGFIDTGSSWTGQTVLYSQSAVTSSTAAYLYQMRFHVVFRNRF